MTAPPWSDDRQAGRWYGKYAGLVTSVEDPEGLGWIKVQVPALSPGGEEMTARPCFAPGQFWVPPVGARVWVEFEAGDPACPLWVGIWYASGEVPDEADIAPPTSHVFHTPAGHQVELSDTDGSERIIIRHKDNAFVAIDENGSIVLSSKTGGTLYLNADSDEASLISPQGHTISMTENAISLVHADGSTTVELKADKIEVVAGAVDVLADSVNIPGSVGQGQAPVLGVVLESILAYFDAHVHATAVGPSGPPVPMLTPLKPTIVAGGMKATAAP